MPHSSENPNDYPRRILVAVTGLSPQIVTETLYALAVAPSGTAFVPTEIHLITTRSGAEKASLRCSRRHRAGSTTSVATTRCRVSDFRRHHPRP
ncbi:hypothetical protein [Candidatus Accumulibacter contiguus]|jgi:CRISPR-associated protein (TIGR02584 family)|uniref:hypothetical protein n=1 Tax=Candidatus Accumulibacter contiguus TaxID=2954381 RepID=UPI002FC33776